MAELGLGYCPRGVEVLTLVFFRGTRFLLGLEKSLNLCYHTYMTESLVVGRLIENGVPLPWKTKNKIRCATEVKVIANRADIVYFESQGNTGVGFIAAIEAKVHDWRRALQQAYRDKLFADRVYVALEEQYANSAISQIAEFRRASVGLITVNQDNVTVHFHPPVNTSLSPLHANRVREFLATVN